LQADNARLRTNDHYFSLTDQMNMGVRAVELDTHEVEARFCTRPSLCLDFWPLN